jgi:phosphatidylglycerol:prolipoprotein diacylglycerol transferase
VRPELFTVGPFTLHALGAAIGLALVAAWWVVRRMLDEQGHDGAHALWLVGAAAVGGVVGARVYYLAEHAGEPGNAVLSGSGLTWYGGLLGGVLGVAGTALWLRLPLADVADAAAPALAVGYAIGRVGCQLAGDGDYGVASDLPWAMSYPDGTVPTLEEVHPTPVYETLASLVIFAVLWRLRHRVDRPWALFGLWAVLAGAQRFLVEFVRRNDDMALGLTAAQLTSLALIALGAAILSRGLSAPPAQARPA